jgi:hypothetical protein
MAIEISTEATLVTRADRREPDPRSARSAGRPTGFDSQVARRFLEVITTPRMGCIELRVLRAVFDRQGRISRVDASSGGYGGSTLAGWFDSDERLLKEAHKLRGVSGYVTFNPVRPDLLARSDNRLTRARHTTRDADILCLRWLYIDIDPLRPAEISSTDVEMAAAIDRRDAILDDQPRLAAAAAWGCSGNGAWILVRLPDYPNDSHHATLVAKTLATLDQQYSDSTVRIDTSTANPARLIGLPGTLKAKGCNRPERPWRRVTLDGVATPPRP